MTSEKGTWNLASTNPCVCLEGNLNPGQGIMHFSCFNPESQKSRSRGYRVSEYFGPVGEKPELLRRDRISFAVNKRPVLAVPSHLRSENILQEKVELLHWEGYSGESYALWSLREGIRIMGPQFISYVPAVKSLHWWTGLLSVQWQEFQCWHYKDAVRIKQMPCVKHFAQQL